MNFGSFLKRIELIKDEFNILPAKQSNDRHRRRITLLVVDEFLRAGGDIHQAFYLEANLYQSLKKVNLQCNPIPDEVWKRELPRGRKIKIKGFNPLKLVSQSARLKCRGPYPITRKALSVLLTQKKEEDDGFSTDNNRGGTAQTFRDLKKDPCLFTKQKRPSLYRAD